MERLLTGLPFQLMYHLNIMSRKYVIIDADRVPSIDFDQVLETSAETLRYSLDDSQTFIKYETSRPDFLDEDDIALTHTEILDVLSHEDWAGSDITD